MKNFPKVYGGLIYRTPILNPLPYIQDADYFVQLSDIEACSYASLEALCLNTKLIVTPLDCYNFQNADYTNSYMIPFELFEEENKENLRLVVKEIYINKDKKMEYHLDTSLFDEYYNLLKK